MDSPTRATALPNADAVEFVQFCYRRRRVGWPELYDEMCAVASRGLFRGWGVAELAEQGIGFSLHAMPALAALVSQIVAEEQAKAPKRATFSIGRLGAHQGRADAMDGSSEEREPELDRGVGLVAVATS
jgi:hypothetical protein